MTVHVAIIKENEAFAAQCLEHDICAQGSTREQALHRFSMTLMGQIALEKREAKAPALKDFPPAPLFYWRSCKDVELVYVDDDRIKTGPVKSREVAAKKRGK